MDLAEYKAVGNDVPLKDFMLRRAFGSWNRVLSAQKNRYPVVLAEPKKVAAIQPTKEINNVLPSPTKKTTKCESVAT